MSEPPAMVRFRHIRNLFDPFEPFSEVLVPWREGMHILDVIPPMGDYGETFLLYVDDRAIRREELARTVVEKGSLVALAEVPAIFAALFPAATGIAALLVAAADIIIVAGLSYGVSAGIAALTAPKRPRGFKAGDDSPNRSFAGIQNTAGPGKPVMVVLGGPIRVGGHIVQSFDKVASGEEVEDGITNLHTLISLGMPLHSVSAPQIDGNPIEQTGATWDSRLGTPDQDAIPGFTDIRQQKIHQRAIRFEDGWVQFSTVGDCDAFEVIFRFPVGLHRIHKKSGNRISWDVEFEIAWRPEGVEISTVGRKRVSADSQWPYRATFRVEGLERAVWQVSVRRITIDDEENDSLITVSASEVYALTEIISEEQAHPGVALVGVIQTPSVQSAVVPTSYTFLVEGNPECRIYSDTVTFTVGYSNNNAWVAAKYITDPTWGLGNKFTYEDIHIGDFIDLAAWCDELVPDGRGGLHKRSTFAYAIDTVEAAEEQIQIFGEGCGARFQRVGGKWRVFIDRPGEMVFIAGEGNTIPGSLRVEGIPEVERANRVTLYFQNEDSDYQLEPYPDELPDIPQGVHYVQAQRDMRGVTRLAQVAREAKRILLINKTADALLECESGIDSIRVTLGAIIGHAALSSGIGIASGRIVEVDSTKTLLTIDEEVTIEPGLIYEITLTLPVPAGGAQVVTKRIVSPPGVLRRLAVADDQWGGADLKPGVPYALGEFESSIEKYRVVSLSIREGWTRRIRAVRYDPVAYSGNLEALPTVVKTGIPDPRKFPPNVAELLLRERQTFAQDGTMEDVIDCDWEPPVSAILDRFEVYARLQGSLSWLYQGETRGGHFAIRGVLTPDFVYDVSVVSVSTYGAKRHPDSGARAQIVTRGRIEQPPTLTNLRATIIDGTLVATVDPLSPEVLGPGGFYDWRMGSTWTQSRRLESTRGPRLETKSYSHESTTIMVRAVNSVGNMSPEAASVSITLRGQVEENIIISQSEGPSWAGTKVGFAIEGGGTGKLTLFEPISSVVYFDAPSPFYRLGAHWFGMGFPTPTQKVVTEGFYTTAPLEASAGEVVLARADAAVDFEAIYIGLGDFDAADFDFDSPEAQIPFSGTEADKVQVIVESRISTTTSAESAFGPWLPHTDRGEMTFRWIQFRLHAVVESDAYSVKIVQFKISIDLPDKVFSGTASPGAATADDVDYPAGYFKAVKRLLVSVIGGAAGDTVRIQPGTSDETGFTYEIRNAAGALTDGTIHFEARGY